ncbi:MAG: VOC family protein [Acidimicrobiales bacterium]
MSQTESIRVSTLVPVDPATAFAVFTEEVDQWFRLTPTSFAGNVAVTGLRFEPEVGGRFVAGTADAGDEVEIARITAWEPGTRLAFVDADSTEVDIRFSAVGDGTRVTLEHRGLGSLSADDLDRAYRYGPRLFPGWFEMHLVPSVAQPVGVTPYVIYRDADAMIDWLCRVFGFEERGRFTGDDGRIHNAELRVGQTEVWLDGRSDDPWDGGERPMQWIGVWVDDVDAVHERICRAGVDAPAPENANYGVRSFNVTDPEGCHWGFLCRNDNQAGVSMGATPVE